MNHLCVARDITNDKVSGYYYCLNGKHMMKSLCYKLCDISGEYEEYLVDVEIKFDTIKRMLNIKDVMSQPIFEGHVVIAHEQDKLIAIGEVKWFDEYQAFKIVLNNELFEIKDTYNYVILNKDWF